MRANRNPERDERTEHALSDKRPWIHGRHRVSRGALLAAAFALATSAHADIVTSGSTTPIAPSGIPPSATVTGAIFVGNTALGTLTVDAGSTLTTNTLSIANNATGIGTVTIIGTAVGPQTTLNLTGPPNLSTINNPLEVGQWGNGSITVSAGAIVNAGVTAGIPNSNCISSLCNIFIGQTAGSTGTLTLTDAGTTASFAGAFVLATAGVSSVAAGDGYNLGTAGGIATGNLNVLNGATLNTYQSNVGRVLVTAAANGLEQAVGNIVVDGPDSTWNITRNLVNGSQAFLTAAQTANSDVTIDVTGGGKIVIAGSRPNPATDSSTPGLTLSGTGGQAAGGTTFATMNVTGIDSALVINGDTGSIGVGRNLGTATLNVTAGGKVYGDANGLTFINVGRQGATGTINIDGVDGPSSVTLSGVGGVNTAGSDGVGAQLSIGRDGGTGTVNVTGGGSLIVRDGGQNATAGGLGIAVGRTTGDGALFVSGPGSSVLVERTGAGGTATPFIVVGQTSTGHMEISDGATVTISGARERDFTVGNSTGVVGTLLMSTDAVLTASRFSVGDNQGNGTATINHATINIDGVIVLPDNSITGPGVRVGRGTGSVGVLNLENNAQLVINTATDGASVLLAGSGVLTGGNGTLNMSGASSISFTGTGTNPVVVVGHSGTGVMTMTGASTLDLPDDGIVYVGSRAAAVGTLQIGGGSTIQTGGMIVGHGGHGTVTMTSGTVSVNNLDVGTEAFIVGNNAGSVGTFTQSGGDVQGGRTLTLGYSSGATGAYGLSGGSLSVQSDTVVGRAGTGTFTQSGGTHDVTGTLILGGVDFPDLGHGTYNLSAGTLTTGSTVVGNIGVGVFNQNGGTHDTGALSFGNCGGCGGTNSSGTYNLSGTGELTAGSLTLGGFGRGEFNQSGSSVATVAGSLVLGAGPETPPAIGVPVREGVYNLSGGTLSVGANTIIGVGNDFFDGEPGGKGAFNQTGGSHSVGGNLVLGQASSIGPTIPPSAGATGNYSLSAGALIVTGTTIVGGDGAPGLGGTGTFTQTGGTHNTPLLNIGGANAVGTYNLSGTGIVTSGITSVGAGAGGVGTVNQSGGTHNTGVLNVGLVGGSTGTYNMSGGQANVVSSIVLGAAVGSSGTYNLSGGASVSVTGSGASVVIGGAGSGLMTMIEGSTLTVAADGSVVIAASSTGNGRLEMTGGSIIQAGSFFGIGHNGTATPGGIATVVLDNSDIYATNMLLGAGGCLAGSGTLHTSGGTFTMDGATTIGGCDTVLISPLDFGTEGLLRPGRSPGILVFDGGFQYLSGTIQLEIQSDGHGGFVTDQIIFTHGSVLGLTNVIIEYVFLDNTDPKLFAQDDLWVLNTFFKTIDSGGQVMGISTLGVPLDSLFAGSTYSASAEDYVIEGFAFDPATGVDQQTLETVPITTAVPEPATVWLLLLGSLLLCFARHGRPQRFARG